MLASREGIGLDRSHHMFGIRLHVDMGRSEGFHAPEARQQSTWLECAAVVLRDANGKCMHVKGIVEQVRARNLRDTSRAKTPEATLRRDLMQNANSEKPIVSIDGPARFCLI